MPGYAGMLLLLTILLNLYRPCSANVQHGLNVCNTTECRDISRLLRALIADSNEPCDDFYKFACGKRSPDDPEEAEIQRSVNNYVQQRVAYGLLQAVAKAVEKQSASGGDRLPAAVSQAIDLLFQCIDYNPTRPETQEEIIDYLTRFAKWPLLTPNWHPKDFDLIDVAGRLKAYHDLDAMVTLDVGVDIFNQQRNALYLGRPNFDYYLSDYNVSMNPRFHDQYKLNISRAIQQLALSGVVMQMSTTAINKVATEIVEFETALALSARQMLPNQVLDKDDIHPLSLGELNGVYNSTTVWNKFFRSAFRNDGKALNWLANHKILVYDINYFKALAEQISKTPSTTVANYLMWKLLVKLSYFFNPDVLYIEKIGEDVSWRKESTSRQMHCFEEVKDKLKRAFDWIYVDAERKKLDAKREPLKQMLRDITAAADQMIASSDWLNERAKRRLRLKLSRMRSVIAYPDWLMNESRLNELYASKKVERNKTYLQNLLNVSKWDYTGLLGDAGDHLFKEDDMALYEVNAYYKMEVNAFLILAGIMEDALFQPNYTAAFKYGLVGSVFGHEMFHGYDSNGIEFDENGVVTNITEMLGDSEEGFKNRIKCIVDAYSKKCYTIKYKETLEWAEEQVARRLRKRSANEGNAEDTPVQYVQYVTKKVCNNGETTLPENLADMNGLRTAWNAYQIAADREATNWRLIGLEQYTPSQLFFLSYATFWCSADQTAQLRHVVASEDFHSTNDARVNVALANFEKFATTWKCKEESKMVNAKKPCRMF